MTRSSPHPLSHAIRITPSPLSCSYRLPSTATRNRPPLSRNTRNTPAHVPQAPCGYCRSGGHEEFWCYKKRMSNLTNPDAHRPLNNLRPPGRQGIPKPPLLPHQAHPLPSNLHTTTTWNLTRNLTYRTSNATLPSPNKLSDWKRSDLMSRHPPGYRDGEREESLRRRGGVATGEEGEP